MAKGPVVEATRVEGEQRRTEHSEPVAGREPGATRAAGPELLQRLQQSIGNRLTCDLILQAKLEVGDASDRYEQEADAVARRVVAALRGSGRRAPAGGNEAAGAGHKVQDERIGRIARVGRLAEVGAGGGVLGPESETEIRSARGGGAPLDGATQAAMEGAFGADFGAVRVHAGPRAAELSDRMQAKAFTIGSDIFFRDGVPDARTADGQSLLAHELTHTIQQGAARTREADVEVGRRWELGCCAGGHDDGGVIRRHSSWEHQLLGDAKPAVLAQIGTWQDLVNQTDKKVAQKRGVAVKEQGKVNLEGIGEVDKGQVMHLLVQELARVKAWVVSPPMEASTDDAMHKAREDPTFQTIVVRLPGGGEDGKGELVSYGELNTLADFYGNYEAMATADPKARHQIVMSVRKETFLRLREIYEKVSGSLTKQEKQTGGVQDAKQAFKDEGLGGVKGPKGVYFKGAITPDYISGMAGQVELIKGVQQIGTTGDENAYAANLARNACHFVPESWLAWADCHDEAKKLASKSHDAFEAALALEGQLKGGQGDQKAIQEALEAKQQESSDLANQALLRNGFGDHYLQDSYAAGHMINKTQVMQWYVEFIDRNNEWDYHKDQNWRKVQQMAYLQGGLSDAGQYDKSRVKGVDTGQPQNAPRNPQSVENIEGDDWQARFRALGLQIPAVLTDFNSDERAILEWWQRRAAKDSKWRKMTGGDLHGFKNLDGSEETAIANLIKIGIVRTGEGVTQRGTYLRGEGDDTITKGFVNKTFVLREDYIPSRESLKKFTDGGVGIRGEDTDDSGYQKMLQAVTYGDYVEFMSSAFLQKATNVLHDAFCKNGLLVKTKAGEEAFKVYGDDAMFSESSSKGVEESGITAHMSRDSILGIVNTGSEGPNTTEAIVNRFPNIVEYELDGKAYTNSLEEWHNPKNQNGLKELCMTDIFPSMKWGFVNKFVVGTSGSLGTITRDRPHGSEAF